MPSNEFTLDHAELTLEDGRVIHETRIPALYIPAFGCGPMIAFAGDKIYRDVVKCVLVDVSGRIDDALFLRPENPCAYDVWARDRQPDNAATLA